MKTISLRRVWIATTIILVLSSPARAQSDPLPSWNDGATKIRIMDFVARVTRVGSLDYVEPAARIAAFDNDGTLWLEHPMYTQVLFALDRVKVLAPSHPEWKRQQPFKAVLEGDKAALEHAGEKGILEIITATHVGMTTEEFSRAVNDWITTTKNSRFDQTYLDLVYEPMVELLRYLRANDFKTYIVSGGGVEFMRPWTERVYGIPPEQVIGSSGVVKFQMTPAHIPLLIKEGKVDFVDDGPGKPVGINRFIGRRPILAIGNSDGDQQMLEWTVAGTGPRLVALVHHTNAKEEYAYDRDTHVGKLDHALDEAIARKWLIIDMKNDWQCVFAFQK